MASTDFLIRSATTLLSIIEHQVEKPHPSSEDRSVRFLDRVALLFVTKAQEDVSAVSAVLAENDSILVECTEESPTRSPLEGNDNPEYLTDSLPNGTDVAEYLLVSKNSLTTPDLPVKGCPNLLPSVGSIPLDAMIGRDWLFNCCRGDGPLSSAKYAMQLQFLLSDIRNPEVQGADINFTRCVYFQCYKKLRQRMFLRVSKGGSPFNDLFAPNIIGDVELLSRFQRTADDDMDKKIARHGDLWIADVWKLAYGRVPDFEGRNLVYDETTVIEFHKLIGHVFQCLLGDLNKVAIARQMHITRPRIKSKADLVHVEAALDGVAFYMDFLAHLVKSPCFWVHTRHPALKEWISDQTRQPNASCEFFDTDNEEDVEAQEGADTDPAGAVTRWLQSASQWSVAVSEIVDPNSRTTRILLSREVKILTVRVPPVKQPGNQSSLNALLWHVSKGSTFRWHDAAGTLQGIAATKELPKSLESKAVGWSRLTKEGWSEWQTSFTGKHHCESVLASLLEAKPREDSSDLVKIAQRAKKAIGVSKRCCFCCALYLRQLNPDLSFGATSGKAYPWALPPWCEEKSVGNAILKVLTERLRNLLVGMGTPTERAYDSGSDSGRSDGEESFNNLKTSAPATFAMVKEG